MNYIPVVIISSVMYLIGIVLAYRATRNILSIPMFVLYIWGFVLMGGLNYYIVEGHPLTPMVAGLSSLLLGLGTKFGTSMAKFKPKRELYDASPRQLSWGITNKAAFKGALVISVLLASASAFIILRNSPLLNPGMLKTELVRPGMGPLMRLARDGLPILSVIWLLIAMKTNKVKDWIIVGLVMGITVLALMLTGYKGFVLWFMVLVAIVIGYLKPRSRKIKLFGSIMLAIGILVALSVSYLTPSPGQGSFGDSLNFLEKRITVEQTLGLDYVIYNLVPYHGFYYGETMIWGFTWTVSDLTQGVIFPNPHPSLTNHIANLMIGHRSIYAVTTMIMGDLYANCGFLGVIIGCFLYGFILGILYVAILRMKKIIIFFPFWVYLSWIFVHMASTGAPIAFFLSQFASLILIYILIIAFYTYFCLPFMSHRQILEREVGDTHAKT